MTLYAPDLPDHIIHGTPGPPWSVLYILVSCWSGDERAMAGSTLMAASFPATMCTPANTVPQHLRPLLHMQIRTHLGTAFIGPALYCV